MTFIQITSATYISTDFGLQIMRELGQEESLRRQRKHCAVLYLWSDDKFDSGHESVAASQVSALRDMRDI